MCSLLSKTLHNATGISEVKNRGLSRVPHQCDAGTAPFIYIR